MLEVLNYWRRRPNEMRCNNGPESLPNYFVNQCKNQGIHIKYTNQANPIRTPTSIATTEAIE